MLQWLSEARDSTLLFAVAAMSTAALVVFVLTIGAEFAAVPSVLAAGSALLGFFRRRDGD